MKVALPGIPLFALLTIVNIGCTTEKPQAKESVLDVGPKSQQVAQQPAPVNEPAPYTGPTYKSPGYKAPASSTAAPRVASKPAYTPPAAAEPVAVAPATAKYVVQKGDTLTSIARTHYGDPNQWKKIAAANPKVNPNAVRVGQELVIPQ